MKKIFQLTTLVVMALMVFSCTKKEVSTEQFDTTAVVLKAYGPQPVVRGGILRFVGSNLDKVVSVTIPGVAPLTPEVVTAGVPILFESFSPTEVLPGTTITIKGDYLNLIHEVILPGDVYVSDDQFISHDRYSIKVIVPDIACSGKIILGTVDEAEEEDEKVLATLNLIESDEDLIVITAEGALTAKSYKAGDAVTIKGTNLNLTKKVELEGADVTEFVATESTLTFVLPDTATDGEVLMVMASEVAVLAGEINTVVPVVSGVTPAPVKNGAVVTLAGSDLDLVTGLDFPNAAGAEFAFAEGLITATVPEAAQEGELTLHLANGKTVTADLTLVKPVVTGFSANPASAGSTVTIEGTNLDLVAAVSFSIGEEAYLTVKEIEGSETAITVAVPTAAVKGIIVLNLKNGSDVEGLELDIDKPVAAYLVTVPADVFKVGDLFVAEIENADHLQKVLFDEIEVPFVINNGKLYATVPAGVKKGTILHLVSDNGTLDYGVNIDPGDRIITTIWTGPSTVTWAGGAVTALSWGGYDWSTVKAGLYLKAVYTIDDPAGCIRFGNGSWASIPSLAGLAQDGNLPLQEGGHAVLLTQEDLDYLNSTGGLVICGTGYTITEIQLVELIPQETIIWTGPSTVTWAGGAVTALSWGGYDWSTVVAGSSIAAHYTIDDPAGCIRFGNGSWASIPSLAGLAADGNLPLQEGGHTVVLTQEDVDYLNSTGGLVICGTVYTIASIGLLVMPEI